MFKVTYDEMLSINEILPLTFNCSRIYIITTSAVDTSTVIVLTALGAVVWTITWDMNTCI